MPGLYAVGDGCTIFGGDVFPKQSMGPGGGGPSTAKTATASAAKPAVSAAPGGQGGAPNGPGGASGGMPMMMGGGTQAVDLKSDGSPCNGLGEAFISGYYAAINVSDYLKKN
jgi:hypothetical protein